MNTNPRPQSSPVKPVPTPFVPRPAPLKPSARKSGCQGILSRWRRNVSLATVAFLWGAMLLTQPALAQPTLMLEYEFNDTGSTTTDSVAGVVMNLLDSSGAPADYHGAPGTGVAGVGQALDFTSGNSGGSGPLAWVSSSSAINFGSLSSFTVTLWAKPQQTISGYPRFFTLGATTMTDVNSSGGFGFSPDTGGNGQLFINGGSKIVLPGFDALVPGGQWTFIALTYDGTTNVTLYTGNEFNPVGAPQVLVRTVTTPMNVGTAFRLMIGNNSARSRAFDGWIDDVRFYTGTANSNFVEAVRSSAIPDPFAGLTTITPSPAVLGNSAVISATTGGTQPISYQWLFTDTNGVTTIVPGATTSSFTITNVQYSDEGTYRLVVSNSVSGPITNAPATLTVVLPVLITDFGTNAPVPGPDDISQLIEDPSASPTGLNYYTDNGQPPGQTFTTGSNPDGYSLAALYIKFGSNGGHSAGNPWTLRLYSLSSTNASPATLIGTYQNNNFAPAMDNNWCKWYGGITNILSPNSVYAYTIRARSADDSSGSGYLKVASTAGDPYPDGQAVLIAENGNPVNYSGVGYDGTFMLNLVPAGYPYIQSVGISPQTSSGSPAYAGTPVTLTAQAASADPSPLHYQWQTDNGSGVLFTDIPGADTNAYTLNTISLPQGTYQFRVVVTNNLGSATSPAMTLYLLPASAPIVTSDTALTPSGVFVGGNAQMHAEFAGTPPITYQWMFDNGSGAVAIPGATNNTYFLTGAQLSDAGAYFLTASNGVAPYTTSSSPSQFIVAEPAQQNTSSAIIADAGVSYPPYGPDDIAQLVSYAPTVVSNLNYYVDNSAPPGQTFTTGNTPPLTNGYPLTSVYVQEELSTAGGGIDTTPQTYTLGVYKVSGGNAVLITSYTTANTLTFTEGDWIQFSGLTNILETNTTYAFSVHRNGSGYWKLANDEDEVFGTLDLYAGGRVALLPASGIGAMALSGDAAIDAAFVVRLTPVGAPVLLQDTAFSPTNTVLAGSNVHMSAYFDGAAPLHYQWYFVPVNTTSTNAIAGANSTFYNLTPAHLTNYGSYFVVATNSLGTTNSTPALLTVAPMLLTQDTTISPSAVYSGQGPIILSAAFAGPGPIAYQWMFNNGSGAVPIPNATNTTYTIPVAHYANSGTYSLMASNNPDGTPSVLSSTPILLTVQTPPADFTANFSYRESTSRAAYSGPGVIGTGTFWNLLHKNTSITADFSGVTGYLTTNVTTLAENGATDLGLQLDIWFADNRDSDDSGSPIDLFNSYMEDRHTTALPITVNNLIPGVYDVVFYGAFPTVGTETYRGDTFTVVDEGAGVTNSVSYTQHTASSFVENDNYVEFDGITVTNGVLNATWAGSSPSTTRGYLNGMQIRMDYNAENPQIFIRKQPASTGVVTGVPASFSVAAVGPGTDLAPGPLFYQWRINGAPIAGATNNTYIPDTSTVGSWSYDVVITNLTGLTKVSAVATLTVTPPQTLVWRGTAGSAWDFTSLNWSNTVTAADGVSFVQGDPVVFDDSAASFTLTLSGVLTPASVTVNGANAYDFTGTGKLSGPMSLTRTGTGTLTLETANDYSGATTISGGTLQVGNGTATGAIGTGPVTNNGVLAFDRTDSFSVSNNISGSGSVSMLGSGTITLGGDSDYSGGFIQANGYVAVNSSTALGTGPVTISNLCQRLTLGDGVTVANAITINPAASGSGDVGHGLLEGPGTGSATLSGPITVLATPQSGGTFNGNNELVVTGPITVSGAAPYFQQRAGNMVYAGGGSYPLMLLTGTAALGANNGLDPASVLLIGTSGGGTFDLAGYNQTLNGLATQGGATVGNSSTASDSTLTISGVSSNTVYGGVIRDSVYGGTRKVSLTIAGGTFTLTGNNTYTGDTTVSGGTLDITQPYLAASSTVRVTGGGILQLDFTGTNRVFGLVLNGVNQDPGVYNSTNRPTYLAGTGSLQVYQGPSGPAQLTNSVSGNILSLSWPAGQNWRLQMQTNSLATGLGTNWVYVTDGSVSSTNIMINANTPTAFYRLVYP